MDELLERIESAHDDFIADIMAGNKSRLPKHANKFNEFVNEFVNELNIKIALANPNGMLYLTFPDEVMVYAALGYKLRLLIDGIAAGVITP